MYVNSKSVTLTLVTTQHGNGAKKNLSLICTIMPVNNEIQESIYENSKSVTLTSGSYTGVGMAQDQTLDQYLTPCQT